IAIIIVHKDRPEYLNICLNAYTRYFNRRYGRKGPLWQGRSKWFAVGKGEEFLNVTRYVHLNPVTAYLVEHPADWEYSSYWRYMGRSHDGLDLMVDTSCVDMTSCEYEKFVEDYKDAQRKVSKFKKLFLE
ncbi:MAG: hypothetical protein HQL16_07720, partial [Candidatus Omnitrophica bacterium]|nr:hypothetical protein [Candidatus Omnitrophota bacterium]